MIYDKEKLKETILQLARDMQQRNQYERVSYWQALTQVPPITYTSLAPVNCLFHSGNELAHMMSFLVPVVASADCLYVSISKTYEHIAEYFKEHINKVFVIDCASANVFGDKTEPQGAMFVDRPISLQAVLTLVQSVIATQHSKLVVIDALSDYLPFGNVSAGEQRVNLQALEQLSSVAQANTKYIFLYDTTRGHRIHLPTRFFGGVYNIDVQREVSSSTL